MEGTHPLFLLRNPRERHRHCQINGPPLDPADGHRPQGLAGGLRHPRRSPTTRLVSLRPPPPNSFSLPAPDFSISASSSPVMIPLPHHASTDGLPSLIHCTTAPVRIPAPSSPLRRDTVQIPIESYNPSESLLISSSRMSPSSRLDVGSEVFDEVAASSWLSKSGSGKFTSSLAASSGEVMTTKTTSGGDGEERSRGRGRGRGAGDEGERSRRRGRGRGAGDGHQR